MTFGKRLKDLRNSRGYTQDQLAIKLDVSNHVLSNYERDYRETELDMIIKLSEVFAVTTDYLLKGNSVVGPYSPYSVMIKFAVEKSGLNMTEISRRLEQQGFKVHSSYIGKLINGSREPASDETNTALARILGIDELELRTLAWIEKIPDDVLDKIRNKQED